MNNAGKWIVLLAVAVLTACGGDRVSLPTSLSVSPDFTAEQTEAIFAAADAWSAATHGVANLKPEIGSSSNAIRVSPVDSQGSEMGGTRVLDESSAEMHIDLAVVADQAKHVDHVSAVAELQDTVMHELGHAFGLDHVDGGLMDPTKYDGCVVDADTLRRFCENYDCR